jgi:hypothetical protein
MRYCTIRAAPFVLLPEPLVPSGYIPQFSVSPLGIVFSG